MESCNRFDEKSLSPHHAFARVCIMAAIAFASPAAMSAATPTDRPLAVIVDYGKQQAGEMSPYKLWRWSPEQKAQAGSFSSRAVVAGADGKGRNLRITVFPEFPWDGQPAPLHMLTADQFPPEADGVVMRLRVESGEFKLSVGGPTAYFGDSDVLTAPQRVGAGDWKDVRFDLHEGLSRNFRRAGFGRAAKVMSYNRWAQEPPCLYVHPGSSGTLLVQSATLVASGKGHAFPTFGRNDLTLVQAVPTTLDQAFTLLLADSQFADFKASWVDVAACRYPPPTLAATPAPAGAQSTAIAAAANWSEEIRWAGLRATPKTGADAVELKVRVQSSAPEVQLTSEAGQPIDIGLLMAPPGETFPWERLGPPEAWRTDAKTRGFDVNLSHRLVAQEADLHVALYHARRFVRANEWQSIVIPFEDFACIAATGRFKDQLASHAPPTALDAPSAVLWLVPWQRRNGGKIVAEVADIRFVRINPNNKQPRRSYPAPLPGTFPQEKQP